MQTYIGDTDGIASVVGLIRPLLYVEEKVVLVSAGIGNGIQRGCRAAADKSISMRVVVSGEQYNVARSYSSDGVDDLLNGIGPDVDVPTFRGPYEYIAQDSR